MKIFILLSALVIAGCGTANTVVLEPPQASAQYSNINIIADNPTVDVPGEVTQVFETELKKGLFESGKFRQGDELQLKYTFVSHNEGNRLARWFWGGLGNSGEATVTVLVSYLDRENNEISKTQVEGKIGSGFFGGSINEAIIKAAQEVANYTVNNFAN